MSEPSKVFLFGSFTEDEVLPFQIQKPLVAKKPEERRESQVNSLGPVPNLTFGSFGSPASVLAVPTKEPVCSDSSKVQKDNKDTSNNLPATVTGNGEVHISNSFANGIHEIIDGMDSAALHLSDDGKATARSSSSELLYADAIKSNGTYSKSSTETHNKEAISDMDVPVMTDRDLLPRGLVNKGNLCFLNATLQALMSCAPFVQLLQGLRSRNISKVGYPTLASFAEFITEFDVPKGANVDKKDATSLETGRPFSPVMFEVVLKQFTPDVPSSISNRPRQEDAQEFLSFIMHQMHDELLKLRGQSDSNGKSPVVSISEDDEWETVGPKNKSAVTRKQEFVPSELSSIFGGELKSTVKAKGNKPSANVQPFLLLHLEIAHENIRTVEDALHLFSAQEALDDYRASSTKKTGVVAAKKSINIQSLPKIMILHLMRFGYGSHGSTKLNKPVRFPLEMTLNRDLLVSATAKGRKYELVSTVTHHGREASKGHYTADVRHENGQWLRFDDASVTAISTKRVLHDQAYILFYKQL